ncbi:MAG: DUF1501 domain-containing protein [Myxococcota bacterium]|nr:DUF1501 domain-containing protein [Myxococcota bacterium]
MSRRTLSRRALLGSAAAAAGIAALPRTARAAISPSQRRFLFIYTTGGWDPTCVFAPLLGLDTVHTEPDAVEALAGNIPYVSSLARPSVDSFFTQYSSDLAVINGVYVPSISHGIALRLMTTGNISASGGDWPTRIGANQSDDFLIPHFLIGGPGYAGDYGMFVARASSESQLAGLTSGDILTNTDQPVVLPEPSASELIDAWLGTTTSARAVSAETPAQARLAEGFSTSLDRAGELKARSSDLSLSGGSAFSEQLQLGIEVLSRGISRCVTVNHPSRSALTAWDSHADNNRQQSELFEDLFSHLLDLQLALATTPGSVAATLAEEVVVVVLSEMGRTPLMNSSGGKDHWPYTSAMALGPGIIGGQVIGGFDNEEIGYRVDPNSGAIDESGILLGQETIGATLMEVAGMTSSESGYDGELLSAILA